MENNKKYNPGDIVQHKVMPGKFIIVNASISGNTYWILRGKDGNTVEVREWELK